MKALRVAARRLAGLIQRDSHDADLREELETLAALQLDEQLAAGVAPDEARRRVLARTGSLGAVQEAVREQRGVAWVSALVRDAGLGLRLLRRNPLFALTAILSLALGIGANAAIFSIVDHLLLRALPVRHANRLLMLDGGSWTYPIWEQIRLREGDFDGTGAWANEEMLTRASGSPRVEQNIMVSGGFFELLGVPPVLGRTITAADDRRGGGPAGPVAVLSHAYWVRAFSRDPAVLGRTVIIERVPFTVVGVMPESFFGPEVGQSFSVAVPFGSEPLMRGSESALDERRRWWLNILIRRGVDQTAAQVNAALLAMQPAIREATSTPNPEYLSEPLRVVSAEQGRSVLRGRYRDALYILMAASLIVLLVTCANVANLLLARSTARRAEMSVRLAIGASRRRLLQQLLVESAVLSGLGVAAGLCFAVWTARLIVGQLSTTLSPVMLDVALDWRVFLFAIGVTAVVTPLFAILPALRATRLSPADAMKEQSRTVAGDGRHTLGQALVLGQIALSLSLVVLAGLLVGTFTKLAWRPLGLDSPRVVVADVTLEPDSVPVADRQLVFERLRNVVAQVPGVGATSLAVIAPMSGRGWNSGLLDIDGVDVGGGREHRTVWANGVSDGFFATYGMAMREGRDFAATDAGGTPPVVIVNEAFVRRFIGNRPALGRRIRQGVPGRADLLAPPREIVGVVADSVHGDLRREIAPTIFTPVTQMNGPTGQFMTLAVRSQAADASSLVGPLTRAVEGADGRLTTQVVAHQIYVHNALTQERLIATVAAMFGGLALVLAIVGLYGVTAYTVSRRRGEIGVRLALGATPSRVLVLVLRRVAILVSVGILAGVALSLWAGEAVRVLLHGLEPSDPVAIGGAALVLLLTGGVAGAVPAWRAARTHPAVALRD